MANVQAVNDNDVINDDDELKRVATVLLLGTPSDKVAMAVSVQCLGEYAKDLVTLYVGFVIKATADKCFKLCQETHVDAETAGREYLLALYQCAV